MNPAIMGLEVMTQGLPGKHRHVLGLTAQEPRMEINAPIMTAKLESLTEGSMSRLFQDGALAVIVDCSQALRPIWTALLENEAEKLPWQSTMRDMARNHHAGRDLGGHVGDMFHYTPRRIAYIARKFEITRPASSSQLKVHPPFFIQEEEQFVYPPEVIDTCWDLSSRIMLALTPPGKSASDYRAAVHRLKYERNAECVQRYYALTRSAVGRWAQLGFNMDMLREEAHGPLRHPGVSDLFAALSMARPLRRGLERINARFASSTRTATPDGTLLIGKAHYDGRYFSAMCGDRNNISTEIFDGKRWHELPMSRDSLIVVPGLHAESEFGIKPTLHRILHCLTEDDSSAGDASAAKNVTLLFGTVMRKNA